MFVFSQDTAINYLKGVGPEKAKALSSELGIQTLEDLLYHFAYRYVDRSKLFSINQINHQTSFVTLEGKITQIQEIGTGRKKRLSATFQDQTGQIELIWFAGIKWIKPSLKLHTTCQVYGKINRFKNSFSITHPEVSTQQNTQKVKGIQAIYPSTEKLNKKGLNSKGIEKIITELLTKSRFNLPQTIPDYLQKQAKLLSRTQALKEVHLPSNPTLLKHAQYTLKFEELFYLQLQLLSLKKGRKQKFKGFTFEKVGHYFNTYYKEHLPFELTGAQKRVVKEIRTDLGRGTQMSRLLQGDVGSGKTVVSLLSILIALDNGFQAAIMAPTEILAKQHFQSFKQSFDQLGVDCTFLAGSTPQGKRSDIFANLKTGKTGVIIGTHALIEPKVQFKNLGLVIIDEQHKFGVAQRAKLWSKNKKGLPHVLIMTATPIPRTLAMTLYGDLDVSVIDELPPGRKPVKTIHQYEKNRLKVFGFIKEQIAQGRQVYWVYPLIEESEKLDYNNLMQGYEALSQVFELPHYKIGVMHGRMKAQDKAFEMQKFSEGKTDILVSTTVIEVGVNVPNASVMVIENAEKFGLSALHQLRGRVGRGAKQSFCILMSSYKLSSDAKTRLETMVATTDGFKVAQADLTLRGPGNLMGTQQSGILDFKIADIASDHAIISLTKSYAEKVLEDDPELQKQEHFMLREGLEKRKAQQSWANIS